MEWSYGVIYNIHVIFIYQHMLDIFQRRINYLPPPPPPGTHRISILSRILSEEPHTNLNSFIIYVRVDKLTRE
jgi:hypothetical protein